MYSDLTYLQAARAGEPSAQARFREQYYTRKVEPKKAESRPEQQHGLASFLRARTIMNVGRFVPLI